MHVLIAIIASALLLVCVSTSSIVEKRAAQDISEAEENFVNSLEQEQRDWWTENRQKVFDSLVTISIGDGEESNQDDDAAEEIKNFMKSLTPTQRGLWLKLQNKGTRIVTKFLASHGTHPLIERRGLARCGGGCILSSQCVNWSGGNHDCRCTWFTCST